MNFPSECLRQAARRYPAAVGAVCGDTVLTFANLDHVAARMSSIVSSVRSGTFGICLPNSAAWLALLSAIWRVDGQAVLFPASLPTEALVQAAAGQHVDVLIVESSRRMEIASAWTAGLIIVDGAAIEVEGDRPLAPVAPSSDSGSRPGVVLFTSGTTSAPKPVHLSCESIGRTVDGTFAHLGTAPHAGSTRGLTSASLIAFPLYHISGLFQLVWAGALCAPAVILPKFEPGCFLDALVDWESRQVVLNPAMLAALVACTDPRADEIVGRLRMVRSGTAALPPATREAFVNRFGVPVIQGYGSTEACGEVAGWNFGDIREFGTTKAASVGRPKPGVSIVIRDELGTPLEPGVTGKVTIKVPWLFDEFRDVGDLGYLDEDGFLFVTGRADDVINCGGFMIQPASVENALRKCPDVEDCAVVGEPDERLGEVPVAYVVARRPGPVVEAVIAAARSALPPYQCPRRVHVVDRLPTNEMGKVLRSVLRATQGAR